jgi:hypothetical protein
MIAGIGGPEKSSIFWQWPVIKFPRQSKHAPTSAIPGPSLGNSPLNTSLNNGKILGSDVLYSVHAKAIYQEPTGL